MKHKNITNLRPQKKDLYILLDHIEKPGNMGAVFRTCDAMSINGLISIGGDPYNPNTIRSSVGCLFHIPFYQTSWEEVRQWLNINKLHVYVSDLRADHSFDRIVYQFPAVLVVGSEAMGISSYWESLRHTKIKIEMSGRNDSLNVSVAAALMLYQLNQSRQS